ncbi:serine hydrolase-like protein isoform X5 [Microtus oregoni]|uniref:serine hydrolase-like protein isoform X5 n=1 Tax=Microtus oregoni TaxID=111838 RepID=UPI001BB220F0|nr:serine hydrolase-like protein isoform X5 [Microtus oregoni]
MGENAPQGPLDRRGKGEAGLLSELKLAVPWGHIAVKVWGSQKNPPVLCLHGWLDNANSFDRLIPLLPQGFHYVAMDFGGHGLSSHHHPGFPYYHQSFVSDVRRVATGGTVGSMETENILTYKRRNIEHMLKVEASQKSPRVSSPEELLQGLLSKNIHLSRECGELLLQRGTTKVDTGLVLNRDPRLSLAENVFDFTSKEMFLQFIRSLQANVLFIKATQGYFGVRRENDNKKQPLLFMLDALRVILKERFQYVEIPGNHYVHMNEPHLVAGFISSFLQSQPRTSSRL